uniref:Uncharacterized protein n=2 Tax=Candidatus Kentrum sp. TUN TaxID=2126343 RepID=A0A451B3U3_9GAMM|nr:MAG: hypothetical protein BECKTUN1418E_GA0071001_15351 [Candidatus Kentron sp. TUN]
MVCRLCAGCFVSEVTRACAVDKFLSLENTTKQQPCYLSHYPTIDFPRYFTVIKDKFLTLTAPVE